MGNLKTYISAFIAILLFSTSASATHNRAGEITYRQIGPLTIEMTITTYTKNSSIAADRDSLDVNWGDGSKQFVTRDNSRTKVEPNDIKINYYVATHTYPGIATYTISFLDPNRIGGILNVNYPNSIDIPFFLSTTFTLLDQQFQGFNNSAVLLQAPIDFGCVNKLFIHNPNAYDIDGDSLAYELTAPLQGLNTPVPGYKIPELIGSSQNNFFTINPITGEVRWDSPKLQGEYNIAIKIKEYRNGKLINVILRDMQILIKVCDNDPPTINSIDEICVIAGEKISIDIEVNDPNQNDKVKLTATGGPFTFKESAVLVGPKFFTHIKFAAKLEWQTNCNHISNQYYQVVLRAADNFNADSTGLAVLKTIRIKVVGPAPENLVSKSINGSVLLEWDSPYACEVTENNYFQGFSVWRKIASSNYQVDTCSPGLSKSPYQRLVFKTLAKENGKYYFQDTKVEAGNTYCYRVQAEFAKLTATNNPFNKVESLPSNESCLILMRDIPLITKVSVLKTSTSLGEIHLRWTKPDPNELDTLLNPGPYKYSILRADQNMVFQSIKDLSTPHFKSSLDTNYIDIGLNTFQKQYSYIIEFSSNNKIYGESPQASSVYLTIAPSDRTNKLTWFTETPWSNKSYTIYRKDVNQIFQIIGNTPSDNYEDKSLSNDTIYCYKVESIGTYSLESIEDPILNDSQEACQKPSDNVAPCAPEITVKNICETINKDVQFEELFNTITWNNPFLTCPEIANDIESYNIYYGEIISDTLKWIGNKKVFESNTYLHFPDKGLLGCYAITAVDSLGNESLLSNKFCVDNCPFYVLPNTFTPNSDGKNDLFKPRVNLFISTIDLKIFNQWGNLVYETSDPNIDWNGTTQSGKNLADGTYYYTCKVFENRVTGITQANNILSGFIHLIRN